MKVIFYSDKCQYCNNMIVYLDKHNIKSIFKLVNIDIMEYPKEIDIVPTIVDTEIMQPLKGKKAFEYLLNIKYFNNPTNNIDYIKDLPDNPVIPEDDKAVQNNILNLEISKNTFQLEPDKDNNIIKNNISNKRLSTLLKLKKK
jgi:hypothetical protein